MTKSFRRTKSFNYIYKILEKGYKNNQKIMIWQNINNKRYLIYADIKNVLKKEKKLVLIPDEFKDRFYLKRELDVYLKTKDNYFVFKSYIDSIGMKYLTLSIPRELYIIELRTDFRLSYDFYSNLMLNIDFPDKVTSEFRTFSFPLVDISSTGAGIHVSPGRIIYLKENMLGIIKSIGSLEISSDLFQGEVIYILPEDRESKVKRSRFYRVGIRFSKRLSSAALSTISKNII